MNTKAGIIRKVVAIVAVIAAIVILVVTFYLRGKVTLYSDETTTGNTSCNLLNGGLFCEVDDIIYFANPYDQNKLYKMDKDMSNVDKVIDDKVSYLNGAGRYLFYTRRNDRLKNDGDALLSLSTTGLFRMRLSTGSVKSLYEDATQVACLYGNSIYYQHYDQKDGLRLHSVMIDGSEDKEILNGPAAPYAVSGDRIYYVGIDREHNIHSMATDGSDNQTIYEGNCTNLSKNGDYLYFMNIDQNYSLCRIALNGGSPETLVGQQIATYNISDDGDTIYYQLDNGTSKNGLYEYSLSSNSSKLLAEGNFNYLHLTSDYLFYEDFDGSNAYVMGLANEMSEKFEAK